MAAVIELSDRLLILKSETISLVNDHAGYYALHASANAVACLGGEPKQFMTTVLLPEHATPPQNSAEIFNQLAAACRSLNINWQEGHTEILAEVTQPLLTGILLAEAPLERRYSAANIQVGDMLALAKGLAIAATAMVSHAREDELAEIFERRFAHRCQRYLFTPGLSLLREARLLWDEPGLHAMQDLTAGNLAHTLHIMLNENELGVEIDLSQIHIYPETKVICEQYGLNPLGIMATGALLIACTESACAGILAKLRKLHTPAAIIGRVLPAGEGRWLRDGQERKKLPLYRCDEILKIQ